MTPARHRAELARVEAQLLEQRQRREGLEFSAGAPGEVELALARTDARIAELEADREDLLGAPAPPAPAARSAVNLALPPANDAARPLPELMTAREAAGFLRLSTDTLERLRQRPGDGPPWKRVGRRILYPLAGLREYGGRK